MELTTAERYDRKRPCLLTPLESFLRNENPAKRIISLLIIVTQVRSRRKNLDSIAVVLHSRYIERVTVSLNGGDSSINNEVMLWMQQIEDWNPKIFTLSHIPNKYRLFVSKFVRRVVIARMADAPDLASVYHKKLREAYEMENKLMDPDIVKQSEERLIRLLDEAETQLNETKYLAGEECSLADLMFIPVLARLTLLNLEKEYILGRPRLSEYYDMVKHRPSFKVVIGRYFSGWRKYRTLLKTICFLCIRSMLRKY